MILIERVRPAFSCSFRSLCIKVKIVVKITPLYKIIVPTAIAGVLIIAGWSRHIGKKVWAPRVFGWRNPFKPLPNIEKQPNCPVRIIRPRFYSFMSIGSSIGSVLKAEGINTGDKPIHSFSISYSSLEPSDTGSIGVQPEGILKRGESQSIGVSSNSNERITFAVDFVQFADGNIWFANPPTAFAKPEDVEAGAQAAKEYLRTILKNKGAAAVPDVLPHIATGVYFSKHSTKNPFSSSGFYYGIINTKVRVEYIYQKNGLPAVEEFLMS